MKRENIDFHAINPAHEAIHARLEDWARWLKPPPRAECSPMFRLYRSKENETPGAPPRSLNTLDAQKIEEAVRKLEEKQARALRWSYVTKRSPVMACRSIGCTLVELALFVDSGRQTLVDWRV